MREWLSRVRRSNARAVFVLGSQGIAALSSLILQVVAARELGASGLGTFSLLFAVLVFFNSAQTGWLGDSLTVLPRFDPDIRRALFRYQRWIAGLAFATGAVAVVAIGAGGASTALLFGVAMLLWVIEETGRRLFLARLEFGELLVNDTIYAVATVATVVALLQTGGSFSLNDLIVAMIVGSAVSIVAAWVRIPASELRVPRRGDAALAEVARFGAYRSAQISMRPLALLAMRSLVVAWAGVGALGHLEVGRLLIAPALTLVNGAGAALLPLFRHELDDGDAAAMHKLLVRSTGLLGVGMAICCGAALVFAPYLTGVITGGKFGGDGLSVLAWGVFAVAFGLGVPAGNAVIAQGRSKEAFWVRAADSAIGLALAAGLIAIAPEWAPPIGLAIGALIGMAWLWRIVAHGRDLVGAGARTGS